MYTIRRLEFLRSKSIRIGELFFIIEGNAAPILTRKPNRLIYKEIFPLIGYRKISLKSGRRGDAERGGASGRQYSPPYNIE